MQISQINNIEGSLSLVKEYLTTTLMSSVKSAVLYGTSNSDDHNEKSDLDILLSFDEITPEVLKKVKKVKDRCASLGIEVDFNTHSEKELPRNSGTDFWHNNRGALFHAEIASNGHSLIGENPYILNMPSQDAVQSDVIRSLSSLVYRMRKLYTNATMNEDTKYTFIKWGIYAASSALAYKGIFLKNKADVVREFEVEFGDFGSIKEYLEYKKDRSKKIPDEMVDDILVFTEKLSDYFLTLRKNDTKRK